MKEEDNMFMIDVNTLAILHQERHDEFVRQAEMARLVKAQQARNNLERPVVHTNVLAAFQQMIRTVLQTHVRAVRPH